MSGVTHWGNVTGLDAQPIDSRQHNISYSHGYLLGSLRNLPNRKRKRRAYLAQNCQVSLRFLFTSHNMV